MFCFALSFLVLVSSRVSCCSTAELSLSISSTSPPALSFELPLPETSTWLSFSLQCSCVPYLWAMLWWRWCPHTHVDLSGEGKYYPSHILFLKKLIFSYFWLLFFFPPEVCRAWCRLFSMRSTHGRPSFRPCLATWRRPQLWYQSWQCWGRYNVTKSRILLSVVVILHCSKDIGVYSYTPPSTHSHISSPTHIHTQSHTCTHKMCFFDVTYSGLIYYYAALSHALKEVNKDLRLQLRVVCTNSIIVRH